MKWNNAIILLLDANDSTCRSAANAWKRRYSVPDARCFSDFAAPGYTHLAADCMHGLDGLGVKVTIVCHGTRNEVNGWNAPTLANALRSYGLRAAGLLAVKSCHAGADNYLDDLLANLGGMQIGWLVGYRETARRVATARWGDSSGDLDYWLRSLTFGWFKMPDSWRIKVVRGNVNVLPPIGSSTRYVAPASDVPRGS